MSNQMGPNAVPPNQREVPQVVVTGGQGAQAIPAASIMGGYAGLTAQQLMALAAASGGAVIPNMPCIPGALRFPLPTPSIADLMLAQGLLFPGAAAALAGTAQPQGYRDYSNGPDSMTISIPAKDHSFPMKLHRILSDPENSEYITWLPHGRSWRVLKPKAFEDKVIPKYFRHAKYASFMRQVNGWGFNRMTQGPDHNSYYHELFLRGIPQLCQKMRRPSKTDHAMVGTGAHPDFYAMSLYAPLPAVPSTNPVHISTNNAYSGNDASDRGNVRISTSNNCSRSTVSDRGFVTGGSSTTTCLPTYSESDRIGSSESNRNGISAGGSGGCDEGDRVSNLEDRNGGGSSDGRNEISGSDRNSLYNEDMPASDPSDTEQISDGNESPLAARKRSGRTRRHPRQEILHRADSSFMRESGSDSSERSSLRELGLISASILSNKEGDLPSIVGDATQDVSAPQVPSTEGSNATGLGLPALSSFGEQGVSQQGGAAHQPHAVLPPAVPLTAAHLSSANQLAAPSAPLTAANLAYLSLQNQLIQSQATIAQLLAYQKAMGLPPMPASGAPMPTSIATTHAAPGALPPPLNPGDQGRQ